MATAEGPIEGGGATAAAGRRDALARRLAIGGSALGALLAWGLWGWLVHEVPPADVSAVVAFYALLFVALALTAALLFWWVARAPAARRRRTPLDYVGHGMLLSALLLFGLWLQSLRVLTLLNGLLLVGIFAIIELMLVLAGQRR